MKKRKIITTLISIIITIILSTILSVYATTSILGSKVEYTNDGTKLGGATTVQAAIDNAYSS